MQRVTALLMTLALMALPTMAQDEGASPGSICRDLIESGDVPSGDQPFLSLTPQRDAPDLPASTLVVVGCNFEPGSSVDVSADFTFADGAEGGTDIAFGLIPDADGAFRVTGDILTHEGVCSGNPIAVERPSTTVTVYTDRGQGYEAIATETIYGIPEGEQFDDPDECLSPDEPDDPQDDQQDTDAGDDQQASDNQQTGGGNTVTKTFQLTLNGMVPEGETFAVRFGVVVGDEGNADILYLCGEGAQDACAGGGTVYTAAIEVPSGAELNFAITRMSTGEVFHEGSETINSDMTNIAWYTFAGGKGDDQQAEMPEALPKTGVGGMAPPAFPVGSALAGASMLVAAAYAGMKRL